MSALYRRVLIVDDEPDVLESFQMILEADLPAVAVTVDLSPSSALDRCRRVAFDLVLSDYVMPEMDGLRFLSEVRRIRPEAKRMLMTAFWSEGLRAEAGRITPLADFLEKPVDPDKLVRVVRDAVRPEHAPPLVPPTPAPFPDPVGIIGGVVRSSPTAH